VIFTQVSENWKSREIPGGFWKVSTLNARLNPLYNTSLRLPNFSSEISYMHFTYYDKQNIYENTSRYGDLIPLWGVTYPECMTRVNSCGQTTAILCEPALGPLGLNCRGLTSAYHRPLMKRREPRYRVISPDRRHQIK
jgi:hypothetical protein